MKRIFVLFGFMVLAIAIVPQSVNAGACRAGDDGCITNKDIAFNAISSSRIADGSGSGLNADLLDGIDAGEFSKKYGNVIVVAKSGGDYTTIQEAVDAASGLVLIKVMPGSYVEDINILSKDIYLQGSDFERTVVSPATPGSPVITINDSMGYISGLSISSGTGTGISITNAWPLIIKNNQFAGSKGIESVDAEVIVEDNTFQNVGSAVYVGPASYGSELMITGNTVSGSYGGCSTSIHVDNSEANATIINNRFERINCSSIYLEKIESAVIQNNYIKGYGTSNGIQIDAWEIVIEGNYISGHHSEGIYLTNSFLDTGVVKNNVIIGNGKGIFSSIGAGTLTISNNQITENSTDIYASGAGIYNVSFNVFDTINGTGLKGLYNVDSNGDAITLP